MYDPTEPGHIPVYNLHDIPIPPPPPPGKKLYLRFIGITLLTVVIGVVVEVTINSAPTTPALQPTPTPQPTTYTAADIVRAFQEDPHLRLGGIRYGESVSAWTYGIYTIPIKAQSSAT